EAIVVQRGTEVIGYMIFLRRNDEYYPYRDSIYIRQFFIQPSYRRRGIGQVVFDRIVNGYFPNDVALTLDVLESNNEAKAFWEKLGFSDYHTTMRRASES
ncbi:MAG: GNAT family N-acetyltransferase, partial [Chloroflexota bacterium]